MLAKPKSVGRSPFMLHRQRMSATSMSSAYAMRRLIDGGRVSQLIGLCVQLGIPDLLKNGAKSAEDLARATNSHSQALYRALRLLASEGVFVEESERKFRLTPLSETLLSDAPVSLRVSALFEVSDISQLTWANVAHSVKTGQPAFTHVFGAPMFEYLKQHSDAAALFDAFMAEMTAAAAKSIAEAYDFAGIATVVDVGGGHGAFLASILAARPDMHGIVFDLPHVISGASATLHRAGVADRCETIAGSFFDAVPIGADAYVLKSVLHDWSDEQCLKILKNCHGAMPPDGRLLVIELDLPPGNQQHFGKYVDMNIMLQTEGGYQRSEVEHRSLFAASGFRLSRVVPSSSGFSVTEARKA
jgi:O-methyltransferase domain